jgi:hypothetical protein
MKAGIIAPFSERRERYLPIFLEKTKQYLEAHPKSPNFSEYEIILAEQVDSETSFNFSLASNVGIRAAFEKLNCDYIILAGIDNIPIKGIDYSWKAVNEVGFLMYGGYKIIPRSFYDSGGNNVFMGWGAMFQDMEFYGRLEHYGINFDKWFLKPESKDCHYVDLSVSGVTSRVESTLKWDQGRNIPFEDLPKCIPLTDRTTFGDHGMHCENYPNNYWCKQIITDAHVQLTDILRYMPSDRKNEYYKASGWRCVDMNQVSMEHVAKGESPKGHYHFKFHSVSVYRYTPTVEFFVPDRSVPSDHKTRSMPWQFANNNVMKTVFTK